jgi:lipoprotein-anchoring transpeptidase ErfK/SrfK
MQGRGIQAPSFFQQPAPRPYYGPQPQQPIGYQPAPQPAFQSAPQYDQPPPLLPQLFARGEWSPGYAPSSNGDRARPMVDAKFDRQIVDYPTTQPPGTIVIDTPNYFLYLVMEGGKALRYGIGVGRPGFTWAGIKQVSAMRQWPDWRPPDDMLKRRPDLPRFMPGGPDNPLGARAIYLGSTLYRIHGSNEPWTIGTQVSSGCIRLRNEDVIDLFGHVKVGTKVVVI